MCVEQADRVAHQFADVVVASIQTLAARQFFRLRRLLGHMTFRLVVVDEAHHAAATTYRTALGHLGFLPLAAAEGAEDDVEAATYEDVEKMSDMLRDWDARAPKDRLLVGVTATPNRSDAIGLGCVFQTIAYSYGLRDAISDGWLVPITAWAIDTQDSLDEVRISRGEFNQKDLAEKVNNARRNELAVAGWLERAYGPSHAGLHRRCPARRRPRRGLPPARRRRGVRVWRDPEGRAARHPLAVLARPAAASSRIVWS